MPAGSKAGATSTRWIPTTSRQAWVDRGELRALCDQRYSYDSAFYPVTQRAGAKSPLVGRFRSAVLRARPTVGSQKPVAASM